MLIFVSHAAEDEDAVADMVEYLNCNLRDYSFFVASAKSIPPGDEWWNTIASNLRAADALVAVLSPRSVDRPWISFEFGAAWAMKKPIVPITMEDLHPSEVPMPLAAFECINFERDAAVLVSRLAALAGVSHVPGPIRSEYVVRHRATPKQMAPGLYFGGKVRDLSTGWVRYDGTGALRFTRGYIDFGHEFNDGYRYPPNDTLNAKCGTIAFRAMPIQNIHFYVACTLVGGRKVMLYAATNHGRWGYAETPKNEYLVPLPTANSGRWNIVVLRIPSFAKALGRSVRSIDGFRARGGMRLSHIWCMPSDVDVVPVTRNDRVTEVVSPG